MGPKQPVRLARPLGRWLPAARLRGGRRPAPGSAPRSGRSAPHAKSAFGRPFFPRPGLGVRTAPQPRCCKALRGLGALRGILARGCSVRSSPLEASEEAAGSWRGCQPDSSSLFDVVVCWCQDPGRTIVHPRSSKAMFIEPLLDLVQPCPCAAFAFDRSPHTACIDRGREALASVRKIECLLLVSCTCLSLECLCCR